MAFFIKISIFTVQNIYFSFLVGGRMKSDKKLGIFLDIFLKFRKISILYFKSNKNKQ